MLGKGLQLKTTTLLVFFLWLVKSLKNLFVIGLLITWRNVVFFLISSMALGLLNQLQFFWQLYLIELLGLLTGLVLLELYHLIYPRLLTWFAGPNTGFEFGLQYECIKLLEYYKRQEILQTDRSFVFCFTFSLDKYTLL